MTPRTTALEVVSPTSLARLDPDWDQARSLVAEVRDGARAWMHLGEVLESLRKEFFSKGGRPCKNNSPHDAASLSSPSDTGWQAKVRAELGISDDTARRWILDAQRYGQMYQISAGKVTEIDGKKVTAEVREEAKLALAEIAADPTVRPARKWAGLWGAAPTKGSQRAAVDHARNIRRAITALATSLEHWNALTPAERSQIESGWAEIVEAGLIPSTWKQL